MPVRSFNDHFFLHYHYLIIVIATILIHKANTLYLSGSPFFNRLLANVYSVIWLITTKQNK